MTAMPRAWKQVLRLSSVFMMGTASAFATGISASATYTATTDPSTAGLYDYSLTLNNTGTTNIGTFWFAWVPGGDFLTPNPTDVGAPAGWTGQALPNTTGTGTSIRWIDGGGPLEAGESLSGFSFKSLETPDVLLGTVPAGTGAGDPVLTSFVYIGAPFADPGEQFVATAATPEPSSFLLLASGLLGGAGMAFRRFKGLSSPSGIA